MDLVIAAPRLAVSAGEGSAGTRVTGPGWVRVHDGVVREIGEGRPGTPDVEFTQGLIAPGLVDLQVNGFFGYDMVEADAEGWATVIRRLPETGVTAFVPTFITAPIPHLAAALERTKSYLPREGARVLGVHLEGPFISPRRKGAHNPEWMCDPGSDAVSTLLNAGEGLLKMLTLAPEREHALEATKTLVDAGILVSIGHTDATAVQARRAADAGARMVTHLFNAQRPLHHREPGVPGHALADERLTSGLIADLHHVVAEVCVIAFAAAEGRICIVTDAASSAGMPPGRYVLGGEPVDQPADGPPLRADGTLAGSALSMDRGVANMVRAGVDLATALDAATRVPADLIGRPDLGRIAPGLPADLVWLGDDLRARATWINGERAA